MLAEIQAWALRGAAVVVLVAALIVLNLWRLSSRHRRMQPAARWRLSIEGEVLVGRRSDAGVEQISLTELARVLVQTIDAGPDGTDVWFRLEDRSGKTLAFPHGATGEQAVLDRLSALPGFELKEMNSTGDALFVCWEAQPA